MVQDVKNTVWVRLGNPTDKGMSLVVRENKDGRLEVFMVGMDNTFWHAWQTSPQGPWAK